MTTKRQGKGRGKKPPATPKAIVKAAPPPVRFSREIEQEAAVLVARINERVDERDLKETALAAFLVDVLFAGNGEAALNPEGRVGDVFSAVAARAGLSLKLDPHDLSVHRRIGAIGKLRNDAPWTGLTWSEREELLPLLALDDHRETFNAGVIYAGGQNIGVLRVREWVQAHVPRLPGSQGRPRGQQLTLTKGTRLAETGVLLDDPAQCEKFAAEVRKAPPAKRRKLVRDLKKTLKGLGALLALIEEE